MLRRFLGEVFPPGEGFGEAAGSFQEVALEF
jgi:hypothetical protein